MKVFVSGGTGVVGWRAVRALVAAGHDVTAMARSSAKANQVRSLGATPIEVDLFDPASVKGAVIGHDAVVNLATKIPALTKARKPAAWLENDRIRTEGSRNLVDAAIAAGASRFVQESIAFLYGDHAAEWVDEDQHQVESPFSVAVRAAEGEAKRFTREGGTGVVLRFGMFYAADSTHTADLVRYARRGWFAVPGPADRYQPMIHADDAGRAVAASLTAPAGVYNVVDDEPLTVVAAAAVASSALNRKKVRTAPKLVTRIARNAAPNLVTSQRVSNERFEKATGWAPRYPSLREGLPVVLSEIEVNPS